MTSTFDSPVVTRRSLLLGGAIAGAAVAIGCERAHSAPSVSDGALVPEPVITGLLSAMRARPIVALGEYHEVQDFHDVLHALLQHPDLPGQIQDIVVEVGSSRYQGLVDRFVNALGDRAWRPADRRYDRQADAVLWLGPGELITASQCDPATYHWGQYPAQLRQLDPIINAQPGSVTYGLQVATAPPDWFAQFEHPAGAPKHKKHRRTK